MRSFGSVLSNNLRHITVAIVIAAALALLLLSRLGSLAGGLSPSEAALAVAPVGWHGIFHQPLYLPLKLVQSVFFKLSPGHGQTLTRLPDALLGGLTILEFTALLKLWHGNRIAVFGGILFACAAWVLHVSRLASYDILYLWAMTTFLLLSAALARHSARAAVWFLGLIGTGLMLYVPGAVWLIIIAAFFMREGIFDSWRSLKQLWQKALSVFLALAALPLLVIDLGRAGQLKLWLGLPARFDSLKLIAKHFVAVPVHLLVHGPQYPDLWLGKAPVLDIFALAMFLIGAYFYATRVSSSRSRLLFSLMGGGWILVALNGPVSLSLLIPLVYAVAATGIAYLLREWLKFFPVNPLARGTGIFLISLLVVLSAVYNLRAYFVAWPHDPATRAHFSIRR